MSMSKAWIVTYTKHIKQKRKVYQDGVLEIHGSTNKVMLYDDGGKLLECRLLRDEVVRSGETLEFNSYLVDIGDPKGSHEHLPSLDNQERNRRVNSSERIIHGQKARNICTFVEKKADVGNVGAPKNHPNVTKKITREYRKSEFDFCAPKSHLTTTKTTMTEWHALYTTQITQKAKKYHDGFLQLSLCGSQGRQVMLYDESRKLLDTRFLKKGEVIGSGETLAFNAHLVDIGDPEGNHNSLKDPNFEGEDVKVIENTGMLHEPKAGHCSSVENGNKELNNSQSLQSAANDAQTSVKEWNALYTKQITQKAKRFHDGILRLDFCSSHRKQVILLDEDGTKLANKYIKFSDVRTGSNLELANYLVQIGEPRQLQGGKSEMNASSGEGVVHSNCSSRITDNLVISRSTPFRDAKQILSILKKPSQESVVHTGKVPVEQSHSSHPFSFVQSGTQDQLACGFSQGPKYFDRNGADDHDCDPKILNQARTASLNMCRSDILEPKLAQDDLVVDITNLMDQNRSRSTFACSPGAEAANISSKFSLGYTDKRKVKTAQSIAKPQASDIILLDLPHERPPSELSEPRRQIPEDVNVTLKQLHPDSMSTRMQWTKKTSFMGLASSRDSASCISTDNAEKQSSEVQNIAEHTVHIGELPSFDLGI